MKPNDLKKWMQQHDKTPTQVAADTGVSLKTVERFLAGETGGSPLVLAQFARLIADAPKEKTS